MSLLFSEEKEKKNKRIKKNPRNQEKLHIKKKAIKVREEI